MSATERCWGGCCNLELVPRFIFVTKEGVATVGHMSHGLECRKPWTHEGTLQLLAHQTQPKSEKISGISENYYPTQTERVFCFSEAAVYTEHSEPRLARRPVVTSAAILRSVILPTVVF